LTWLRYVWLIAIPVVPWVQMRVDSSFPFRTQREVLYLWSPQEIRRLVPGFEDLAADIYWLRTVQYFGGEHAFHRAKNYDLLLPLIDITTTLDPKMEIAYRYGAIFLSEPRPVGAGRPEEGIRILERGVKNLPNNWRLRQDLGFFYFLFLKDPHRAAEILLEASQIPGAAFWLRTLAADLLAKGGDRDTSRKMWTRILEQSEEGIMKQNAQEHLVLLDALDAVDALSSLVVDFRRRTGRNPRDLSELVSTGLLQGPAVDPAGSPFAYDPASGKVAISSQSPLWRPE
jgi:hypothetical protein